MSKPVLSAIVIECNGTEFSRRRCGNIWGFSVFGVWQLMVGSVCNLPLKVVDFVDLRLNRCNFMVFLFEA